MSQQIFEEYRQRGWAPIPLAPGSKVPRAGLKWSQDYKGKLHDGENIGVALGERSGDLVDIDLDWPEAVELAEIILADTTAAFGRKSAPKSHYLFRCKTKTAKFQLPSSFKVKKLPDAHALTVTEIRSSGAYTMFPGSVHPSGEKVGWANNREVAEISESELRKRVGLLSFLAVCKRFWGDVGTRHDCALATAGILRRAKVSKNEAEQIIEHLCRGDDELSDRLRAVADTYDKPLEQVSGVQKFSQVLGLPDDSKDVLYRWLGVSTRETYTKPDLQCDGFNEKYAVIRNKNKVGVLVEDVDPESQSRRTTYSVIPQSAFLLLERPRRKEASMWLDSPTRRSYPNGFCFDPKQSHDGYLNLWRGWAIDPKPGSWRLMKYHIESILADDVAENSDYIIRWLAWSLQNPAEPAEVALVFRGKKGCGKGTLGRAMCKIAGQHGLHVSNPHHLVGNFNLHMRDCVFLFADEAFWAGDKKSEGTLKRIITEDTLLIEQKGVDVTTTKNRLHIMIASNEDWVVPASTDERRFAVFNCSDDVIGDKSYFQDLNAEIVDGGLQAMMQELLEMDLGDWHPRYDVPRTAALRDQIQQSERADIALLREILEMGVLPGTHADYTRAEELLYPCFRSRLDRTPFGKNVTDKSAGTTLARVTEEKDNNGLLYIGENRDDDEPRHKRVRRYLMPPLEKARERFDPDHDWPDTPGEWTHERAKGDPIPEEDIPF